MFIESIQITTFAGLRGYALDLTDGVNVLEGKNESGKSTVAEFIRFVLYGFNGKPDRERYTGLGASSAEGSLILKEGDKRFRVERKSSGAKEICGVYDLDTGSPCFEGRVPGEALFGIPSEMFPATAFVGQAGGSRIDGRSTAEAVDNLLFSADESINIKKALKRLDDARVALLHKNKKGGKIFELETKLAELRTLLAASEKSNAEILALESSVADLRRKLSYEEESRAKLSRQIADFRVLELRRRNQKLRDLEEDYQTATREAEEHHRAYERDGFFPDNAYWESLKSCGAEIERWDARVKEIEAELDALNRQIQNSREEKEKLDREEEAIRARLSAKRGTALAMGVLFCLLFLGSALGTAIFYMTAKGAVGTFLAVATILLLGLMIGAFVLVSRYTAVINERERPVGNREDIYRDRLERIGGELTAARNERMRYKTMLDDLCGKWRLIPTSTGLNELKQVLLDAQRLTAVQEQTRMAYVQMKAEAEAQSHAAEVEDDGRALELPTDFDIRDAVRRMDLLDNMIRSKNDLLHKNEVRLAELNATVVSPAGIYEAVTALEYERDRLQKKHDAYLLAAEKLTLAGENLRASVFPRLSTSAGALMGAVTDGKYEEIGVDSALAMSFRPETENGGRMTCDERYMSAGTSDAAYISLRLALAALVGRDGTPPMIFDESFARMDDTRLGNMLKLLAASGGQILLFTSCGREAARMSALGLPYHAVSLDR